ncbi:hypothetical protein BDN72DRAFT_847223 [Pluteus cervinus]|uniref:Uncharacterized protein n=1 Tax=Pluteus cervinus TaxID=181527 RepID=A0ACD3AE06_9AGAR|nr:hypothetical protein BDN72DRAFT_847223 [Pluteus cervinus]
MRANFFTAAILFALVSSTQARAILPRQAIAVDSPDNDDGGSIGSDSGSTIVDCYKFPEECQVEEGRSVTSTDAAGAAQNLPLGVGGLLESLLGGLGQFGGIGGLIGSVLGGNRL